MPETLALHLKNDLRELTTLQEALTAFGERHDLGQELLLEVNVVLEEILTNIISNAYEDSQQHEIHIRIRLDQGELTAEVEDDGRPFDPTNIPPPDFQQPLEERRVGGWGFHLVRAMTDGLEYRREAGRNILSFNKRANAPKM